jgi:hypothetical protein
MRNPCVWEVPCKISRANTGIKSWYGIPMRLTSVRSIRIDRIGTDPNEYVKPSLIPLRIFACCVADFIGFILMAKRLAMTAI